MCGVVGALVFSKSAFQVTEEYLIKMREAMVHRGPDGAGLWISNDKRIGMGHRRLSIIDLSSAASQPMCNEDGTLWIVFNGEIYNHQDVRKELEQIGGHRWKTDHADTEVILHAFEQWGVDCLHKFRGMFAIALWDMKKRELWLIRDRIGKKPLYYSLHDGRVTFASEIKALLLDPQQKRAVDEESFYHYLSFLTTPSPKTLFEGIKKLPNGSWLKINEDGGMFEHRYWDVWDWTEPQKDCDEEEIAERILAELRTSVKLRKVSDVPVGIFLSGGIDSSVNAVLFSEGEACPVKTFTIGYEGDFQSYKNEMSYARTIADLVHAEHYERLLTVDDLIDILPRMIRLQDEPIADPVCIPVYYVSQLARTHGVSVCQVGEGSDELFWGYPGWRLSLRLQKLYGLPVAPYLLNTVGMLGLGAVGKKQSFFYEWMRRKNEGLPIFWGGAEAFPETQKKRMLSPRLKKKFEKFSSWEALKPIRRRFEEKSWEPSDLHWMSYVDLNFRLPELLLMRLDKMSMGVSLEGRMPFLDHKFVELALSIPETMKTKDGILKYILKKAVRGLIPDEIIDRPKQGFGVPVNEWFFEKLGILAQRELSEFCERTDLLDRHEVMKLFQKKKRRPLWYLLNFALWWKEYIYQ
jgi:asparagine synthase (glutamine-hydrolysing)